METNIDQRAASQLLSLAVDHYNRYPGEQLTVYLEFTVPDIPGSQLQILLPRSLMVESHHLPPDIPEGGSNLIETDQHLVLNLPFEPALSAGKTHRMEVITRIHPFYFDHYLTIQSRIIDGEANRLAATDLQVAVFGKGKYLQFLPAIYESDDFTSRFLMMFESFWKPISNQIDQVANYFDPALSPTAFIPWLASWLGIQVDELLPTERVRKLIKNAMMLFQCRGTYQALSTMLEIYTAGKVNIIEHQARNFVLGSETSFGMGVALGTQNRPNTISVHVDIPRSELARTKYSADMYQRKIEEVIRSMVPAHTIIQLACEFNAQ